MGEREEVEALEAELRGLRKGGLGLSPVGAKIGAQVVLASDWLAAHDERVRASERERLAGAWEDGYDAGHRDARAVQATYPDATPNPHAAALRAPSGAGPHSRHNRGDTMSTDYAYSDVHGYAVADSPKLLRETLCVAQARIGNSSLDGGRRREHIDRLQRLIDECDRKRPLGRGGKHDGLHTDECGCRR